jgi:putative thioredoxin
MAGFPGMPGSKPPGSPTQPTSAGNGAASASWGQSAGAAALGGAFGAAPQGMAAAPAPTGEVIKESTTATFMADVIDASFGPVVVVDFWAPWCGPCKQLGPALEKVVREQNGKVILVKINVDENQDLAAQMRIQSIPAVYAFKDGRPVDGFAGALPESQLRQFIGSLAKLAGPTSQEEGLKEAMAQAEEMVKEGDLATAIAIYAEVLAQDPNNAEATAGMARCYLTSNEPDKAKGVLAGYKPEPNKAEPPAIAAVRAAIELAEQSSGASGELAQLAEKVAADPADHQARFDLAVAHFAAGAPHVAVDELLEIVRRARDWNEGAARAQLLKIFEALGPMHEVTLSGRRRLSSILFS